jgi:hypothetical protein
MAVNNPDHKFATDVLNASVAIMSILVAVIAIVAVEYKNVQSDPALANPVYWCVIGATAAAVFAGVISLLSLLHLRVSWIHVSLLFWLFGILIVSMVVGIIWVVDVLVA